jgi:glutathione S-transferase
VADAFPKARLWPEGDLAKALARRLAVDAYWSFQALAEALPFDARSTAPVLPPAALAEVQRVRETVHRCARHGGATGPYLFGAFSVADAAFAPLVLRLVLHGIELEDTAVMRYMAALVEDEGMGGWFAAAEGSALQVAS